MLYVGSDAAPDSDHPRAQRVKALGRGKHSLLLSHSPHLSLEDQVLARSTDKHQRRIGESSLQHVWSMADDVQTSYGVITGTSDPGISGEKALETFRRYHPSKNDTIVKAMAVDWSRHPGVSPAKPPVSGRVKCLASGRRLSNRKAASTLRAPIATT